MQLAQKAISLPGIATGITTLLGAVGLIVYIFIVISKKAKLKGFSTEVIQALKITGITVEEAVRLPLDKLELLLKSQTSISEHVIKNGINHGLKSNLKLLLWITVVCFILAAFFGVLSLFSNDHNTIKEYDYSAYVLNSNKQPVVNAIVNFQNQSDISTLRTDSKGFFKTSLKGFTKFSIIHEGYDTLWINKYFADKQSVTDTITVRAKEKLSVTIKGNIFYADTKKPVFNAAISIDGDPEIYYSDNQTGYYHITYKFSPDEIAVLRIRKHGYPDYFKYLELKDSTLNIDTYLER